MNLMNIKQAAAYLKVSPDTLRLWDKNGKLVPSKTPGGHRRYTKQQLDEFMNLPTNGHLDYGALYEHLCSAVYIAQMLKDENADELDKIRVEVGQTLLKIHEVNMGTIFKKN